MDRFLLWLTYAAGVAVLATTGALIYLMVGASDECERSGGRLVVHRMAPVWIGKTMTLMPEYLCRPPA